MIPKTVNLIEKNGVELKNGSSASLNLHGHDLAQAFLLAWQQAHGTPTGSASLLSGDDMMAIMIEGPFTKAEITLAKEASGQHLLQRYVHNIFSQLMPELLGSVETVSGRLVTQKCLTVSLECQWICCLFKLGQPRKFS